MNLVIISGYLGADPELRFTQGGQAVLNMRVATSETWLDKNGTKQERTEWVSVVIWGKRAEGLAKHLSKGNGVEITGRLQTSSYEDKEGVKRYKTEVICDQFEFGKGKGKGSSSGGEGGGGGRDEDRGQRGGGGSRGGGGQSQPRGGGSNNDFPSGDMDPDDDIPF